MIEQLFKLIQSESTNEIINNPVIPNENNNHAIGLATDSIFSGLQGALANGGLKDVLGMFTGKGNTSSSNPIVGGIIQNFVQNLMSKFGIDSPMASSIAASLIPSILGKLVNKTNDPNDSSIDINGIIGSLMNGNQAQGSPVEIPGVANQGGGIDFGSILSSLTSGGMDSNKDGQIGLDDLAGIVGQVASGKQQPQQNSVGGIMDLLKGFMQ